MLKEGVLHDAVFPWRLVSLSSIMNGLTISEEGPLVVSEAAKPFQHLSEYAGVRGAYSWVVRTQHFVLLCSKTELRQTQIMILLDL